MAEEELERLAGAQATAAKRAADDLAIAGPGAAAAAAAGGEGPQS